MMRNPFGPQQDPGLYSYANLHKRLYQNVHASGVNDKIFKAVQKAFDEALQKENLPLIQLEKKRLLARVMKQVLTDMLTKLDNNPKA